MLVQAVGTKKITQENRTKQQQKTTKNNQSWAGMGKKTNEKIFPSSKALVSEGLGSCDQERQKYRGSWVDKCQGLVRSVWISSDATTFFPTSENSRNKRLSLLSSVALDVHWCGNGGWIEIWVQGNAGSSLEKWWWQKSREKGNRMSFFLFRQSLWAFYNASNFFI